MNDLTDAELAILRFEGLWFRHAGSKEAAIRHQFGVTPTKYYQRLNQLLDIPAAMVAQPQTVARLRRLRSARRASRCSLIRR